MPSNVANATLITWWPPVGKWRVSTMPVAGFRPWRPAAATLALALAAVAQADLGLADGRPGPDSMFAMRPLGVYWSAADNAWVSAFGDVLSAVGVVQIAELPSLKEAIAAAILAAS
jgi:hypothetical protein